ncbi:hypothetical protein OHR86_22345 [Streptomyces sp. NBC_00441]|uniref:hypothetical protein n=1 Tax=Streptomyces sp. NBC_00441 TaxID=2975742 RepID=UPI002E296BFF|nr:hypothetical protein [Streptomyces sp. NBC_00441]
MPVSYAVIDVDFTGAPGTDTSYALERATTATGPYTLIAVAVPLLAEQDVYTDTTAPFSVPLYYRATGDQTGAVTTYTAGPLDQAGQVWLRDPLRPWADLALDFCDAAQSGHVPGCTQPNPELVWVGLGDERWRADAGLFDVLNSETPADVWARRKHTDTSIIFFTRTLAAADRVYELFTAGGPLFLQLPPEYGWSDAFVQPGDVAMSRISRDQRRPERRWEVPITVVDRPLGPAQGTACANWCALPDAYPTYGDLPSGLTLADLAGGNVLCPGGEPVEPISDTFSRTVAAGWGSTDTGQPWTNLSGAASDYNVTGGVGTQLHPVTGMYRTSLVPAPSANQNIRADFAFNFVPTGDAVGAYLVGRAVDQNTFYTCRLTIGAGGATALSLRKRIAGVETQIGATFAPGLVYTAGARYSMRLSIQGSTLTAKVWPGSAPEPAGWQVTGVDTDLTAAQSGGVRSAVNPGVSNPQPLVASWDNFWMGP